MSSAASGEVTELLRFLRDREYIQGLNSVSRDQLKGHFGWSAKKLYLILETCSNLGYVGLIGPSDIFLTSTGIKALLLRDP